MTDQKNKDKMLEFRESVQASLDAALVRMKNLVESNRPAYFLWQEECLVEGKKACLAAIDRCLEELDG